MKLKLFCKLYSADVSPLSPYSMYGKYKESLRIYSPRNCFVVLFTIILLLSGTRLALYSSLSVKTKIPLPHATNTLRSWNRTQNSALNNSSWDALRPPLLTIVISSRQLVCITIDLSITCGDKLMNNSVVNRSRRYMV